MPLKVTAAVSIVIPNWNGLELLERFLPSVIAAAVRYGSQFDVPTEMVIVDDGSADKSVEWLRGQGFEEEGEGARGRRSEGAKPALRLISNETNQGFGPTCNRGFEAATHPLVFLINNDVAVEPDAIAPLAENFSDGSVFAVHCRTFDIETEREVGTGKLGSFSRGFIRVHRSYLSIEDSAAENRRALYSMFASGGSAMFDRRKFLEIGKFDSLFAPIYWEDVDISYRAWKRGLSVLYESRSVVRHRVSSTMRKIGRRRMRQMQQRNRLIYHWINLHDRTMFISHVMWVAFLALTAVFRFRPDFLLSLGSALRKLPEIRKRRREEKQASRRSDRDVFNIFTSLETRADVFPYDEYSEMEAIRKRNRKFA